MFVKILLFSLLLLGTSVLADQHRDENKDYPIHNNFATNNHYDFLTSLNNSLQQTLTRKQFKGLEKVFTFQKDRQVVINIIHNPYLGYQGLVDNIAQSASRVNGINLQNTITLKVLENYCKQGLFYHIEARGLLDKVRIQYETPLGRRVAVHKINRKLCN